MTPFRYLLIPLLLFLGACGHIDIAPKVDLIDAPARVEPKPQAIAPTSPTGGLFQLASFRPAFEDRRARLVGDTVTINILENVTATQKSTSNIGRTGSSSAGISALPFMNGASLAKLNVGANSANTFAGKGNTENTNTFSGSITPPWSRCFPMGTWW